MPKFVQISLLALFLVFLCYQGGWPELDWNGSGSGKQVQFDAAKNDQNSPVCGNGLNAKETMELFPPNVYKYLLPNIQSGFYCGRLGNWLYRFASLYALGRRYGRKAGVLRETMHRCEDEWNRTAGSEPKEAFHFSAGVIERVFPVMAEYLEVVNPSNRSEIRVDAAFSFPNNSNAFDDPKNYNLNAFGERYLQIGNRGAYFQHFKYFHHLRAHVRKLLQFSTHICARVHAYGLQLFGSDASHKFCVHTRRGDFVGWGQATDRNFTERTIAKITDQLGLGLLVNVSVVLLGEDKQFLRQISVRNETRVYVPKSLPPGEDLAFGALQCDSLLITATSSTYAFWLAYLMKTSSPIYYNGLTTAEGAQSWHKADNFLPEWTPIWP